MHIWRIARKQHLAITLEGVGARLAGGRWSSRGVAVVYCAETPELAALEVLVHASAKRIPRDLLLIQIHVPDTIKARRITLKQLKGSWRAYPSTEITRAWGDRWIKRGSPLVLRVPSVVTVESENVLLNPAHPDMRRVKVVSSRPWHFDPRFFRTSTARRTGPTVG